MYGDGSFFGWEPFGVRMAGRDRSVLQWEASQTKDGIGQDSGTNKSSQHGQAPALPMLQRFEAQLQGGYIERAAKGVQACMAWYGRRRCEVGNWIAAGSCREGHP